MKKILVVLLTLALCVSMLASCDIVNNVINSIGSTTTPTENTPAETTPAPEEEEEPGYNLPAAVAYVHGLYKDKVTAAADFEVTARVAINGVVHTVEWTDDSDKVTIEKKDDYTFIVKVDATSVIESKFVLTATITGGDETATKSFTITIPPLVPMTWDEYIAKKAGEEGLCVQGVVTGIVSKTAGATYNCVFLQDATGGAYYIYGLTKDPIADYGIEIGMTVAALGSKDVYNGTHEIKNADLIVVSEEKTPVAPMDYTEIFKNATAMTDEALVKYQSSLVTIKGVEIGGQKLDNGYLYFLLDGKQSYLRISGSTLAFPAAEKNAFIADHEAKRGYIADVTGIISLYDNAFYLVPVSTSAFNYIGLPQKAPEEAVQDALEAIELPTDISKDTELELPAVSKIFENVTFTWASENADFAIVDNKVSIKLGAAATTLKLTVTATCEDKTATKEFTIQISANVVLSTTNPYIPSLFQAKLDGGKTLYLDGTFGERYLNTTDDITKAVAIYAEKAEGGYKFYILVDGAKNYIYLYTNEAGKSAVKYDANNANVFSYNKSINAWVTDFDGKNTYLGTYNTYNTVSSSATSYITPENTGVEQFPLEFTPVVENVAMNGTLFQAKLDGGKILYLDGTFGERYLNTTDDITKAVAIYAEKAEGGYKFYILVDDVKNYIYLYTNDAGKSAVKYDADNANIFKFDGSVNAWVTDFGGKDTYLGTYNTYNTVSSSATSYITPENTGIEQFPLNYIIATGATPESPENPENPENPDTPDTPDTPAEDPAADSVLTIEQAIALGASKGHDTYTAGKYYVTGVIIEIYQTTYGNMKITDAAGNILTIYGTYNADGTVRYDALDVKPSVGDTVTVYGIVGQYGGNAQIKNGWITAHTACEHVHEVTEKVDATCTKAGSITKVCSVCKLNTIIETIAALGHTTEEGTCERCNQTIGGTNSSEPVTASKTVAALITELGWTNTTTKQEFTLDANVTVKINGGSNTGKAYNGDHIRIYATDSPAGTITITLAEGYELVSIKITAATGTYAFLCVDGTTADICNQSIAVSGSSVVLTSVRNGDDGKQIRVTAIEVVYKSVN